MATVLDRETEQQRRDEQAEEPRTPKRSRKFLLPIVAIVALIAIVWGVREWSYARSHESTDDAQVDGHVIPVLAKVGGYVQAVHVVENQHVKDGQTLVQLDSAELHVHLEQALADLAAARAAAGGQGLTGQAQSQVQSATSQRAALQAQIDAARAQADNAQANLVRMKQLAAQHIVSQQQLDAAQTAADAAQANLEAAQRQAAAAGASVNTAQAGVRLAEAKLEAAQAAVDNAQLQLSYTTIIAPESGQVSKKNVEVGQLVQPGQPLMAIVADTGVWVTANMKETQMADIHVGESVEFSVDAYNGAVAEGTVESISPATGARFALLPPDNATGNFTKVVQRIPVRIRVTKGLGTDRPLRPGMSVTVHVKTK
ncbi:MAG TPA: HlyD family secretion protein [Gemmatimonadaceae bacterium]|jgi:membrane fusion protein (multidrug efflux system)|nr:HlyD family secretion protein [Gemmatimonadaceae bacterium]